MSVKYVLRKGINPVEPDGPTLYRAIVKHTERVGVNELAELISDHTSATAADVKGVLDNLIYILTNELLNSRIVRMGDLGSFRGTISSAMAQTPEAFNASYIRGARIVFTPGALLRDSLRKVTFTQVSEPKEKEEEEPLLP